MYISLCCNSLATVCPYCYYERILCDYPYHCDGNPSFWQLPGSCWWPYVQAMAASKPFCLGDRLSPINTGGKLYGYWSANCHLLLFRYSVWKLFPSFLASPWPHSAFSLLHSYSHRLSSFSHPHLAHSSFLSVLFWTFPHPISLLLTSLSSFPLFFYSHSFSWCQFSKLLTAYTSIRIDLSNHFLPLSSFTHPPPQLHYLCLIPLPSFRHCLPLFFTHFMS